MDRLTPSPATSSVRSAPARGFWRRRVLDPLAAVLAQGTSRPALARAIAAAAVCGLFPFLGTTTLLTLAVGLLFRLNQPVMHAVNQLLGPVQLLLIPVFVAGGAWLAGTDAGEFSVETMLAAARDGSAGDFLRQFGRAGWYALLAWAAAVPLIFGLVLVAVRPWLGRLVVGGARS